MRSTRWRAFKMTIPLTTPSAARTRASVPAAILLLALLVAMAPAVGAQEISSIFDQSVDRSQLRVSRIAVIPNRLPLVLQEAEKWRRTNFEIIRDYLEGHGFDVVPYDLSLRAAIEANLPLEDTFSSEDKLFAFSEATGADLVIMPYYGTGFRSSNVLLFINRFRYSSTVSFQVYSPQANVFFHRADAAAEVGYSQGYGFLAGAVTTAVAPESAQIGLGLMAADALWGLLNSLRSIDSWHERAFQRAIPQALEPLVSFLGTPSAALSAPVSPPVTAQPPVDSEEDQDAGPPADDQAREQVAETPAPEERAPAPRQEPDRRSPTANYLGLRVGIAPGRVLTDQYFWDVPTDSFEPTGDWGFTADLALELGFSENLAIQTELGATLHYSWADYEGPLGDQDDVELGADLLHLSVLAKPRLITQGLTLYGLAGPMVTIVLGDVYGGGDSQWQQFVNNVLDEEESRSPDNRIGLGFAVGAGVGLHLGRGQLVFDAVYRRTLTSAFDDFDYKFAWTSITAGYLFRLP